jgi:hypothetical protein
MPEMKLTFAAVSSRLSKISILAVQRVYLTGDLEDGGLAVEIIK